jgi:CRP/FNR family transcriptional regulator
MLAMEHYSAEGVAETDLVAVAIPRRLFEDLLGRSPEFRSFVFRTYSRRIADLFLLIDEIVFRRLDVRLAARLLALAKGGTVAATHQFLATELGTAREVVSRTLQDFQRRGWIAQARGEIRLANPGALGRLARSEGVGN